MTRFLLAGVGLSLIAALLSVCFQREIDHRLAVSNGCASFNPKTAAFAWVYRQPDPSVPSIPIEALGPGQALGRAAK